MIPRLSGWNRYRYREPTRRNRILGAFVESLETEDCMLDDSDTAVNDCGEQGEGAWVRCKVWVPSALIPPAPDPGETPK